MRCLNFSISFCLKKNVYIYIYVCARFIILILNTKQTYICLKRSIYLCILIPCYYRYFNLNALYIYICIYFLRDLIYAPSYINIYSYTYIYILYICVYVCACVCVYARICFIFALYSQLFNHYKIYLKIRDYESFKII